MYKIHADVILKLLEENKNDSDIVSLVTDALASFQEYHAAVYAHQIHERMGHYEFDGEDYSARLVSLDAKRTSCHNSMISQVNMLNRFAQKSGLPPVYDGVVSTERPYRRELANAVFQYIEEIINNRS